MVDILEKPVEKKIILKSTPMVLTNTYHQSQELGDCHQ